MKKDSTQFTRQDVYFAEDEAEKTVSYLTSKADYWFYTLTTNKYLDKVKRSWAAHHGVYYEESHEINFGGEQGELVNVAVNHFRNLATHTLNMVTATRPAFQARSVNTDSRSQIQTTLANGLLEYYMREKRLEVYLKTAVEQAIVLGSGYIKMEWNATAGEIHDVIAPEPRYDENGEVLADEEGNLLDENGRVLDEFPIYEGDVEFKNLSVFDVVFDSTKESHMDHDWVLCRTFKNKYDLAKKYPEYEEEIKNLMTKSDKERYSVTLTPYDQTLDVPVYEFFHRKSESVPDGRYILYLSEDIVLMDSPMPYRKLPVYRITPSDILGTPYGYTSMFDILALQDLTNSLYSTIATNQSAFGVQNILNARGNDVHYTQVNGGLNFIEYTPIPGAPNGGRPEAMNLTQTPGEIFNFLGMVEKAMETISGVNSVARGNPEASLKSGTALALVQSQALQFMSGLQQSYIMMIEDIGTGLIQLLQDFAEVPRIAEISGIANRSKMKQFTGRDIDSINRVVVDVGNAMAQTTAGRVQMADNLLQMGLITSAEMYLSVINTGKLETMTEGQVNEQILIRQENERLLDGSGEVVATNIDQHNLHIRQHKAVLMDVDARMDPEIVARTLAHIQEHLDLLRSVDPDLLAIISEQALAPQGGSPAQQPNNQPNQGGAMQGMPQQGAPNAQLPQPAQPPTTDANGNPVSAADVPLNSGN